MLVTIIIPSYNHEKYIKASIQSVLNQSYHNLELIVIDDGSTDRSRDIVSTFSDRRMRVVEQSNRGAHETINRGMGMARGDYIAILNSDDVFHPNRVERCIEFMDRSGIDFCCTWIEIIDGSGTPGGVKRGWENMLPRWANQNNRSGYWASGDFNLNLLSSNFISTTSNMFFRRAVMEKTGGMRNLRFTHDWDFALRVASSHSCALLPEALMQYRIHGSNTITSDPNQMLFETSWVLAANLHLYEGKELFGKEMTSAELVESVRRASSSIRVIGCEQLIFILSAFIRSRRAVIGPNAEEEILNDQVLKGSFVKILEEKAKIG